MHRRIDNEFPPKARRSLSLFSRRARMKRVGKMKFSVKPFSKGLRSLEAAPQVAIRRWRNSPLETRCPSRVSIQTYKKERPTKWLVFPESLRILRDALLFLFWLIPVNDRNQKGISPVATGDSGRCPKNPRPFEKGRRKLYLEATAASSLAAFSTSASLHISLGEWI